MINRASLTELSRGLLIYCNIIMLFMVLWKMPRARARQFFSSGLEFGLETQKPRLGLETCWTRTRVLCIWTRTRTRDMRTRTRLGLEETRTRCISALYAQKTVQILVSISFKDTPDIHPIIWALSPPDYVDFCYIRSGKNVISINNMNL